MKGLILKELYILKGYGKQYLLIFAFLFIWSISTSSFSFIIIYVVLVGSQIVMSTMAADEAVSFCRYALTMPVDRKMLIKSKYALFLTAISGGILISVILNLLFYATSFGSEDYFQWESLVATASVFVIGNAISLPVMFKAGVEKARYVTIFTMLLLAGVIVAGIKLGDGVGLQVNELEKYGGGIISLCFIAVAALAIVISYFVAVRITKNKEW
ncbi:MAG: ABC-2 transporter permease [Lachnospiraceae bacterium]|nr:ABC-2 transporter permease [Lachnospiraceae bacterium]